jgi:hypothetical protein
VSAVNHNTTPDLGERAERLFTEIHAYLAVVDAMRREGIEPSWAGEPQAPARACRHSAGPERRIQREVWG